MRFRAVLLLFLAFALSSAAGSYLCPATAHAQVEDRLEKALQQAQEDYDVLEIQAAEKKLEDAIDLANSRGVTGAIVGKLYVMLGVVRFAATRDEALVKEAFVQAAQADPKATIPDVYSTPDLRDILQTARDEVGVEEVQEPDKPSAGITHTPITDIDAAKPVVFEAFVPRDMPVYRMFVYFRVMGEEGWKKVEMQPTNAERFAVKVAGEEFYSSQFDYYIEAVDRGGNILGSSGSVDEPHNVVVIGSTGDKKDGGDGKGEDKDGKGKGEDGVEPDPGGPERQWVYVSLLVGTSPGILTGADNNVPTANPDRDVSPGIVSAFGHGMLDAGVLLNDKMSLGLFLRYQFSPFQDFSSLPPESPTIEPGSGFWDTKRECFGLGLPGDCILGVRYRLFVNEAASPRFYSTIGAGVGRVRNWLRLKQRTDTAGSSRCADKRLFQETPEGATEPVEFCFISDTVRTGWLHLGVGGGVILPLADAVDLQFDSYLMVLAPTTSINLDLNGGLRFKF